MPREGQRCDELLIWCCQTVRGLERDSEERERGRGAVKRGAVKCREVKRSKVILEGRYSGVPSSTEARFKKKLFMSLVYSNKTSIPQSNVTNITPCVLNE